MAWSSRLILGVLLMVASSTVAVAQFKVNRYIVFFKDKAATPYSIAEPEAFLSPKTIARRQKFNIPITEQDLPVNPTYVAALRNEGVDVYFKSRWMNAVLIETDTLLLPTIEGLSFVQSIEYVAPRSQLAPDGRKKAPAKLKKGKGAQSTDPQLDQIGLDDLHAEGFRGEGITIAVMDGGFPGVDNAPQFSAIFSENRINVAASHDFTYNSEDVFQYDNHGTQVLSVIAAYQEGTFTGGAYKANYLLYVTEHEETEYRVEEYNWLFAAEAADSAGADVINTSLGYYDFDHSFMNYPKTAMDGKTTVISRAAQIAADKGMIIVCSAGNEGTKPSWRIITAPADVEDVLAVASVNLQGERASSSSVGRSLQFGVKPDVAALGVNTDVVLPNGGLATNTGTSLASPLIASLAACIWQKYPDLTNKEIIELIRKSGSQADDPDTLLGYGIPNFTRVVTHVPSLREDPFVIPNPVGDDTLIIHTPTNLNEGACQIEVVSIEGKVLIDKEITFKSNSRYAVDVSSLGAAMYLVRIYYDGKIYTHRIIKL